MPTEMPENFRAVLALALVPGLGPKLTASVLEHFGTAEAVLQASANELKQVPMIGKKLAEQFAREISKLDVEAEWRLMQQHNVRAWAIGSDDYPKRLAEVEGAPPLLYIRGTMIAADENAIGIVGSRNCTEYGLRVAHRLGRELAQAGWTVVSGLARGIDGAAHRGALDAGGRTIAALAGGLANIYPPEHYDLAKHVASQGALLTETPMTRAPQPGMFPARNRIISALSRGVVIVEASQKSGALITATHAAEQGRDVFVIPGNVTSDASAGCLELIRKGARLVRNADDILEDVAGIAAHPAPNKRIIVPPEEKAPTPKPSLDPREQRIWDALTTPCQGDKLAQETGLPAQELAVVLMKLEMKKLIRRLPGNQYARR